MKKWLPKWLKRPVKNALLRRRLRGAIQRITYLADGQIPSRELLSDLIVGWGNEGYSANLDYLEEVARRSVETKGPILECGSGVTTILLGILSSRRKTEVWSLEHSSQWESRVTETLVTNGISGVHVCAASLLEYDGFAWYDAPLSKMPSEFTLVICDGPPGTTKGGRYGLLPVMGDLLPPGTTVLLDDAGRPGEIELIERWKTEFQFETERVKSPGGEFAIMQRRK
jgi:hypothetical protein